MSWRTKVSRGLSSWAFVLALMVAMLLWSSRDLMTGKPPEIQSALVDGQSFIGLDSVKKPAVVYFWGSWCPVCKAMQPTLRSLTASDVPVLSVALQSGDAAAVNAYLSQQALTVPTVADETGDIARRWGVKGVPALFIIDRNGNVRYSLSGYTTTWGLKARLWFAGLED